MSHYLLIAIALAAAVRAAPVASLQSIYGQESFVTPQGQWPPVTSDYSSGPYKRAIFLSFDGMHQFDLTNYVAKYSDSAFASLLKNAVAYSNAMASSPSDSLPATASLFTGASPRNHGIWWEQMYDRSLYGNPSCTGPPGAVVDYSEACDLDNTLLSGGNGFNLSYLPHQKTTWGTCETVYPYNFLRTNTIFEVGRANGLVTAYADKHLSYQFLTGPSGVGLSEGYFPEIASIASTLQATEDWDDLHWSALRNWTLGNFVNGTKNPDGAASLYGANFQAITFAQQNSGYLDASGTPNASLEDALKFSDQRLGSFVDFLRTQGVLDSTLLLVGSKQGQGPVNPKTLQVQDPSVVTDAVGVPVSFFNGEDGGIMYLAHSSDSANAKSNLLAHSQSLGISSILAGPEITAMGFGSPTLDPRVPDVIISTTSHELWNSGFEFEDHGGFGPQDLHVPLLVFNPGLNGRNVSTPVNNRQVGSTMLQALGLPLGQLDGWRMGEAPVLPGVLRG